MIQISADTKNMNNLLLYENILRLKSFSSLQQYIKYMRVLSSSPKLQEQVMFVVSVFAMLKTSCSISMRCLQLGTHI